MNEPSTVSASHPGDVQRALRSLAFAAVIIGVLVLAAAAFALSYSGIHAIALAAGVSPALAKLYPVIFDAMLVIAAAAVLSLRTASFATRCYAWLCLLLLLFAAAGADALHATGNSLPHQVAAATVAIIPWALVLLGFGLLLVMLRHARLHRARPAQARADAVPRTAAPPATAALPVPVPAAAAPAIAAPPDSAAPPLRRATAATRCRAARCATRPGARCRRACSAPLPRQPRLRHRSRCPLRRRDAPKRRRRQDRRPAIASRAPGRLIRQPDRTAAPIPLRAGSMPCSRAILRPCQLPPPP